MSVGLLLITHNQLGTELVKTATNMLGLRPLTIEILPVLPDSDSDSVLFEARRALTRLDQGEGVLTLTDMYGSTPSNVACQLTQNNNVVVVAGVNLPMLIRVLNYSRLSLAELALKALSGGREGIIMSPAHFMSPTS